MTAVKFAHPSRVWWQKVWALPPSKEETFSSLLMEKNMTPEEKELDVDPAVEHETRCWSWESCTVENTHRTQTPAGVQGGGAEFSSPATQHLHPQKNLEHSRGPGIRGSKVLEQKEIIALAVPSVFSLKKKKKTFWVNTQVNMSFSYSSLDLRTEHLHCMAKDKKWHSCFNTCGSVWVSVSCNSRVSSDNLSCCRW